MKYLAVDLGEKRIGIAISDDKGIIADPFSILIRKSDEKAVGEISKICASHKIDKIVIGYPAEANPQVLIRFKSFSRKLALETKLPVANWDETFSTKQAENMVAFPDAEVVRKKTRQPRTPKDDVAAAIILQEYLDHENRS